MPAKHVKPNVGKIPKQPKPATSGAYEAPQQPAASDRRPLQHGRKETAYQLPSKRRVAKPHSPKAMAKHLRKFL